VYGRCVRQTRLRDTPVHHHHLAEGAEHHVLGFEVAMDDTLRVCERDRLADPFEDPQALGHAARRLQVFLQRAS
jgi:hypothetical protein